MHRPPSPAVLLLLVLAVVIALASLLLTGSRGGLIAFAAEVAIASVVLHRLRRRWAARRTSRLPGRHAGWWSLAAAAAATVLGAALLFSWVDSGWASKRLALLVNVRSPNWVDKSRASWTLDSLRMLRDHPVLGVGLGVFGVAYPGYQSTPGDLWLDHAHNDYAEVIAETGLVGAALIGVTLALFVRLAFGDCGLRLSPATRVPSPPAPLPQRGEGKRGEGIRGVPSRPSPLAGEGGRRPGEGSADAHARWIRLGAAIGCCGLLAHSFFDFNLHIPANAAWFAVLAGLAVTGSGHRAIE